MPPEQANRPQTYGPFQRPVRWSTWWVLGFGAVSVGLLISVMFRAPFMWWALVALVTWGTMEGIGVLAHIDACPPLTHIVREYVPRWLAFGGIYFLVALAGGTWFQFSHRWELAALAGLLGWLTAHFDVTFDAPAVELENAKYAYWADKLGAPGVANTLLKRQQGRWIHDQERQSSASIVARRQFPPDEVPTNSSRCDPGASDQPLRLTPTEPM